MNVKTGPQHTNIKAGWAKCELKDSAIVELVLGGNDAAFEAIMRRYNRMLFRLARGIVRDDEDARDVVQESFVRAYFRLSQFNGPTGFPSWLARIVINEATSRIRKSTLQIEPAVMADDMPSATQYQPEDRAVTMDTLQLLESAIGRLPTEFRTVFMLRGVEQLSTRETAELLGIKPATVKTRLHRARLLLQKSLSRELQGIVPSTFSFDGERCDQIVANVFAKIGGIES